MRRLEIARERERKGVSHLIALFDIVSISLRSAQSRSNGMTG